MLRAFFPDGTQSPVTRQWIAEVPVAIEYNGIAYAVMMATPQKLEDFVTGFALTEGLADSCDQVRDISLAETDKGWIVRASLSGQGAATMMERARTRVAESSCGLCGIENLEAIARPLPPVVRHGAINAETIFAALNALGGLQVLGPATGAAHGAAWADDAGQIGYLREDVGRHNAMDKLIGAMARAGHSPASGFILSTARCSYEIVEKAVKAGAATLVTISLPTSMAVERARDAGLSLWALARKDSVLLVNDASA